MLHQINFITKHIDATIEAETCDTVCAFTGEMLTSGVKKKKVLSSNFTDYEAIKFESDYISVDAAKVLGQYIRTDKGFASLRSFSYLATENELKILKKDELWAILANAPEPPFVLAYTFNSKKHTAIKAKITTNKDCIYVITDTLGLIKLERNVINELCPIVQSWYSAPPEMKPPHTYFTKEEILFGSDNVKKITEYGIESFRGEDKVLAKYRNTNILTLLTRLVNRCELK